MGTLTVHFENGDEISFTVPEPVKLDPADPVLTVTVNGENGEVTEETTLRADKALWTTWKA